MCSLKAGPGSGLVLLAALLVSSAAGAEPSTSRDGVWRRADRPPEARGDLSIREGAYAVFEMDAERLSAALARLPLESEDGEARGEPLWLPMPDGTFEPVAAVESPVMEPELAARFPEIRTYRAQGVEEVPLTVGFDRGPLGFHAILLFAHRTVYIAPYRQADTTVYVSYDREGLLEPRSYRCDAGELPPEFSVEAAIAASEAGFKDGLLIPRFGSTAAMAAPNAGTLRVYRLAVAAAADFTLLQSPPLIPSTIAAIASSVSSVNAIFNRDLAVRFRLVGNNGALVFTNPATDPYTVGVMGSKALMMPENQVALDGIIGNAGYDIGHVFSGGNDGGIGFPFTCLTGFKAFGVSQGGTSSLLVEQFAHELGHQLGATHTFSGNKGHCADPLQLWPTTAYEPGSGSTIMSYGGDCDADNIVGTPDLYFHAASLEQIINFTVSGLGSTCPAVLGTGNHAPTLAPVPDYVIPRDTPFTLSTFAIDPDEFDHLTLTWEQMDLSWPLGAGDPILRSRPPSSSGARTFPRMEEVLSGQRFFGELLPASDRALNFRVTARDNHGLGANVTWDDFKLAVEGPPFRVTSPNRWGLRWAGGSPQLVTWTPLGVAANVNILISVDGGQNWISLAPNTPNDGAEVVTVPALPTVQGRIKVEAVGNVYFDVSDGDFSIYTAPPLPVRQGEHTSSTCKAVEGWVWDMANPANTEYVDIYEDQGSVLVLRDKLWPGWNTSPGSGDGTSGFWWPLPRSLKNGTAYNFRVRFAGTSTDLNNTPLKTPACSLFGFADPPSCTRVTGFAMDPDFPGDSIAVDVWQVNSSGAKKLVSGSLANLPAPAGGPHGFDIPLSVATGKSVIQVRFSDTNLMLPGSGVALTCP